MTLESGLPAYDDARRFPARVWEAVETSRRNHFDMACMPEVGRLLQLFAGARGMERIGELGTAYGVGAAWIESGMAPNATLFTIEIDSDRARGAKNLFADNPAIEVVTGDWSLALQRPPFDLLFSDGGPKRAAGDPEKLLPLVCVGGLIVLDDYTPGMEHANDEARRIWLDNPAFHAVEIPLSPDMAVILARKLPAAIV